jgi:pimeloyl-ACP methyl ester carboxylesterase
MKADIIILHGWGLSGDRFASLVSEFKKKGYSAFSPDLPGFGKSRIPDNPQTLENYADFLHDYIRSKKLKAPILIGHSFGGRVALFYQFKYPSHISALILSGTPGFTPVAKRKIQFFVVLAKIGKVFFSIPPLSLFQESVRKWFYYIAGARDFYRAQGVMRETFKTIVQQKLETAMKSVRVPVLLIWGELDQICPVTVAKRMHALMPASQLDIVPNMTHAIPFKEPEIFSNRVEKFLKTV